GELEEQHVHRAVVLDVVHDEDQRPLLGAGPGLPRRGTLRPLPRHGRFVPTGTIRVNVEPWRGLLSSVMRPPRTVARRRQIARPRPVPPASRVGGGSACEKASKIRVWSASAIPIPVSMTAMEISWLPRWYTAVTVTEPRGVNLSAFVRRFSRICLTFC